MVLEKCLPRLRRRLPTSHHVFGDCRLGNFKPEHQEFAMNSGRAPQRVFLTHPLDGITQATIDLRPPCPISGFPAPVSPETRAMPPQDGLRLHRLGQIEQPRPNPGHPDQQCPIAAVQSRSRWRPLQGDIELIAEKQVLGFKPASRLEHVGDKHSKRVQDRQHRSK